MALIVHNGTQVPIEAGPGVVIGRLRECGLQILEVKASRKHARVFAEGGSYHIEDLGSANGTHVNDEELSGRRELDDGDIIRIGSQEIVFHGAPRKTARITASAIDPASLAGRLIAGHQIEELLGRGGMGYRYRATQLSLDRDVVFKAFHRRQAADEAFAKRFLQAAGKAGAVGHPAFVNLHESGRDNGLLWYTSEPVEGDSLRQLIERDGRMDPLAVCVIGEKVAQALAEAHRQNIVHRDLSTSAIMLSSEGKVRILDLAIGPLLAQVTDRTDREAAWCRSPQVLAGAAPAAGDDIYALGCIMYHLLTAAPPFTGGSFDEVALAQRTQFIPSAQAVVKNLPKGFDELLGAMLAKDAAQRCASMERVIAELRAVRDGLGATNQTAEAAARRVARFQERQTARQAQVAHQRVMRLVTVLVVLVLIAVGWALTPPSVRSLVFAGPPPAPPAAPPVVRIPTPPVPARSAPITTSATPAAVRPVAATAEAAQGEWVQVQAKVAAAVTGDDFSTADFTLAEYRQKLADLDPAHPLMPQVDLAMARFRDQSAKWYRAQVAALPTGTHPADLAALLVATARLSGRAAADQRGDADARYQEALVRLIQQLASARRKARQAVEAGRFAELPLLADSLAEGFAGTHVAALQRTFAAQTREAARAQKLWQGDWPGTRIRLAQAGRADAVAAGAILLLASDVPGAMRAFAATGPTPDEVRRRETVLGREAAVMCFDDPGDLQYIEVLQAEPRLEASALRGAAGEDYGLACAVPVGGKTWDTTFLCQIAPAKDGELVFSLMAADQALAKVTVSGKGVAWKLAGAAGGSGQLDGDRLRLRLAGGDGNLTLQIGGKVVAQTASVVPAGSRVRMDASGCRFAIEEWYVLAGE